mmetsp:Transcript_14387/g.43013  ORF Transcript_14387/g.43013 Transcript_14387/m.43013 type:complete len:233 (-) Transcript_14387:2707-3405(-)
MLGSSAHLKFLDVLKTICLMSIGFTSCKSQIGIMPSQAPPVQAILGRTSLRNLLSLLPTLNICTGCDFQSGSSEIVPGELPSRKAVSTFLSSTLMYIPAPNEYISGFELHLAFIAATSACACCAYASPLCRSYSARRRRVRPVGATTWKGTESMSCMWNDESSHVARSSRFSPMRSSGSWASQEKTQGLTPAVKRPPGLMLEISQPTVTWLSQGVGTIAPESITLKITSVKL